MNTTYDSGHAVRSRPFIRPAWTPATIALMIIGFMIFWPLGLAMLAYILWGDRLDEFKESVNFRKTEFRGRGCGWSRRHRRHHSRTGNVAFDDWRATEIKRLEEERAKLDEMRKEFDEHLHELRRARDQEEFDAFMATRDDEKKPKKKNGGRKSVPEV